MILISDHCVFQQQFLDPQSPHAMFLWVLALDLDASLDDYELCLHASLEEPDDVEICQIPTLGFLLTTEVS